MGVEEEILSISVSRLVGGHPLEGREPQEENRRGEPQEGTAQDFGYPTERQTNLCKADPEGLVWGQMVCEARWFT